MKIAKVLLLLIAFTAGGGLLGAASLYLYLSPRLPSPETLRTVKLQTPMRVYSSDNKLIATFGEVKRNPLPFEAIPQHFIHAILAAEDDSFYRHNGVDITGLLRAASELVRTGEIQSGGSTITMQLARNFFLSSEQTFTRKFNEILLALRIEEELNKNEILTLYANKVYLGHRAYGVSAAAEVYYGKAIDELTLPQLAMIAGLPKAPSAYNPITNKTRATARRDWILSRMLKLGHIDQPSYQQAVNTPDDAVYHNPSTELDAPYIAEMARQEALNRLGMSAYNDGYRVYTTVESELQQAAVQALRQGLETYDSRHGYRGPERHVANTSDWAATLDQTPNSGDMKAAIVTSVEAGQLEFMLRGGDTGSLTLEAVSPLRLFITENRRSAPVEDFSTLFQSGDLIRVRWLNEQWQLGQIPRAQAALASLDPDTGAIRALVGGYDFTFSNFNRATQAERQPGSNFKPFVYTRALESGMTAATLINDAPVVFQDPHLAKAWRPENDSGQFYGPTRLRKGLYLSRNLVSIRILRHLGVEPTIASMGRFGFDTSKLPPNLSLALGTQATTPLTIANGYTVFANGGYRVDNYLVERIEDAEGNVVHQANPAVVCRDCNSTQEPGESAGEPSSLQALFAQSESSSSGSPDQDTQDSPPRYAEQVVDPRVIYIMDSILKDAIIRGTGRKARSLERGDIAGKTGTTNGPRDAWFSGYSPHLVTTVWVGFDENLSLGRNEYGGSAALPIWIEFMGKALAGKPEIHHPQPPGLVTARIDPDTGQRVPPGDPKGVFEYFLQETVPPLATGGNGNNGDSRPQTLPEELF